MRSSKQRDAVLNVLYSSCDHPTADLIYDRVKTEIPNISLGTVYRNLGKLIDEGVITIVETGDKKVHYEGNLKEHVHFFCTNCCTIFDVFCDIPVPLALSEMGFQVQSQKTVYYGICEKCRQKIKKNQ